MLPLWLAFATALPLAFASRSETALAQRATANDIGLRILPLGASIVWGQDSTDGNGFRECLRQGLTSDGKSVNFVGTHHHGNMTDNSMQAQPGDPIATVDQRALDNKAYDSKPNVILILAGTDDCNKPDQDPDNAPSRYATLLSNIKDNNEPSTLVVVSNLIHNLNSDVNACVQKLNKGIYNVSQQANSTGQNIAFVDMYNKLPSQYINTTDKTHPTDQGYQIMAQAWHDALMANANRVQPAAATPTTSTLSATATKTSGAQRLQPLSFARALKKMW